MFHTRFNVAEVKNKYKVYDRHDNVDRVSYVDNTKLIQRLIYEGQNLAAYRAQALRTGLYSDQDAFAGVDDPIIPVYEQDPAIMQPIVEASKAALKSRVAKANDESSNDDALSNSDLAKRSPDSKSDAAS